MPFFAAFGGRPLPLDRLRDGLEDLAEPLQAQALARLLEQLELQLRCQLEPRCEGEGRLVELLPGYLDLGAGSSTSRAKRPIPRCTSSGGGGSSASVTVSIVPVWAAALRQLEQVEPSPPSTTMGIPSSNWSTTSTTLASVPVRRSPSSSA